MGVVIGGALGGLVLIIVIIVIVITFIWRRHYLSASYKVLFSLVIVVLKMATIIQVSSGVVHFSNVQACDVSFMF